MVLHPHGIEPILSLTKQIATKAFLKGNLYMTLRDELGTFYNDGDFAERSAYAQIVVPGRLAKPCFALHPKVHLLYILGVWL